MTKVLKDNSAAIAAKIRKQVADATRKAAVDIEAQAKDAAPVDTGYLRASIVATPIDETHWRIEAVANYAKPVEAKIPYLMPAYDQVGAIYLKVVKRILRRP